jgi:dihydroneopterin aldolase
VTDRIAIVGLRARGRHGVFAAERELGQVFVVDVELGVDTRAAATTDDLALTVDYGAVATRVEQIVGGEPCELIETLAQRIADACLDDPQVLDVHIVVHKPQAPIGVPFEDVTVSIRRSRP